MNLYRVHGKENFTDKEGKEKSRPIRAFVVAESEEAIYSLVTFEINHIMIEASTDESIRREKLIIQETKKSSKK